VGLHDDYRWLVFGDSHIEPFRWASANGLINRPCDFIEVAGATAVGLRNPNSATNALRIYAQLLLPPQSGVIPVMQLGEVDCGFVIWWRAIKLGESPQAQLEASVAAHTTFVDRLLTEGYRSVVLTGATLPTILDGQNWGEVANKRRDVTASLVQRTQLTVAYNRRLREAAERRGLPYIDIGPSVIDPATGVIASHYRNRNPINHHLHSERAGKLWATALNEVMVPLNSA
jgi:hypothetical protein